MPATNHSRVVNRLIDGVSRKDQSRILQRCEPVELVFGAILCEPDRPFKDIYFPLTGFVSLVAVVGGHPPLEMGLIGSEGMLGATLALGVATAHLRGVVQAPGTALRMTVQNFQLELHSCPALRRSIHRYLYVLMAQLSQTAICTRFHEVDARLARWLLLNHDRAHADTFHFTHAFLADMLGVRRSGITIAAGALQRRNLIRYTRGEICVLDRIGLEAAACECYAAVIKDYAQFA